MEKELKKAINQWLKDYNCDNWQDFVERELYDEQLLTTLIDYLGDQERQLITFYIEQIYRESDNWIEARVWLDTNRTIIFSNDAYFCLDSIDDFIASVLEYEERAKEVALEPRVYVIDASDDEVDFRQAERDKDYKAIISRAENIGSVYSIQGFQDALNDETLCLDNSFVYISGNKLQY